jgi:ribosomal protein S18 acetylase RimI-like enzyme
MTAFQVRTLRSEDFEAVRQLETAIFGGAGYDLLCPYYVRLCTDFYADTCFLALADGGPVGYILCLVRDREAYCPRLGVRADVQGTGAAMRLMGAVVRTLIERRFDRIWFTVKPDNTHARALYQRIGAVECGTRRGFFAPGDELIVHELDRHALERLHHRLESSSR